ncbi:hypothetical protein PPTG_24757, partial [Phytophthora nicotianae INRA-310]
KLSIADLTFSMRRTTVGSKPRLMMRSLNTRTGLVSMADVSVSLALRRSGAAAKVSCWVVVPPLHCNSTCVFPPHVKFRKDLVTSTHQLVRIVKPRCGGNGICLRIFKATIVVMC